MSLNETAKQLISRLRRPEQDLATLSFCQSNKAARVKTWAESLPVTRINHVSVLLYKAIPELSRIKSTPANRLQMLETLRPYVQQCIHGLSKEFLNQPLILPKNALKTAVVAQALQKHMTIGYITAIREIGESYKSSSSTHKQLLTQALHRAINGLGLLLLRGYQLYITAPNHLWLEVHTLYRIAKACELCQIPVIDPLLGHTQTSTINHTYTRILLLACARPNQLRQNELLAVYSALEDWTSQTRLIGSEQQSNENLFIINLCADLAPMYKSRYRGSLNDEAYELDTTRLLAALRKQKDHQNCNKSTLRITTEITPALLEHLTSAWGKVRQRDSERNLANGVLEVTVGVSNLHHHLSRGIAFTKFLMQEGSQEHPPPTHDSRTKFNSRPLSSGQDPWANALDAGQMAVPYHTNEESEAASRHPICKVHVVDTSANGYCLEWRDQVPVQVRTGELLGLREPGRRKWSVGVVRWLRQNRDATQLGVQILALSATPYGASMVNKTGGDSEYMRVLMLPEVKSPKQPATLLTTVVPFQEYSKVKLKHHGEEKMVQLTHRLLTTGSISQFSFRSLESTSAAVDIEDQPLESLSSLWNSF